MKLAIINRSSRRVPRQFLSKWVAGLARQIRIRTDLCVDGELGLIFMDPKAARSLNKSYRGRNYATDVLSFDGDGEQSLGELVLCSDVIRRQAKEHELGFREELGYMVIHGVLHLLGFEHESGGRRANHMFALQDQIFEHLCRRFETAKSKTSRPKRLPSARRGTKRPRKSSRK